MTKKKPERRIALHPEEQLPLPLGPYLYIRFTEPGSHGRQKQRTPSTLTNRELNAVRRRLAEEAVRRVTVEEATKRVAAEEARWTAQEARRRRDGAA